jgi:hypothetical protein
MPATPHWLARWLELLACGPRPAPPPTPPTPPSTPEPPLMPSPPSPPLPPPNGWIPTGVFASSPASRDAWRLRRCLEAEMRAWAGAPLS